MAGRNSNPPKPSVDELGPEAAGRYYALPAWQGPEGTDLRRAHLLEQFAWKIFRGDYKRATSAMSEPYAQLGGRTPREAARTHEGMLEVRELINRLQGPRPRGIAVMLDGLEEALRREFDPLLDLLPAAWGLTDEEFEHLLEVPPTWLRAWRNHEAKVDGKVRERLKRLRRFHEAVRLVTVPSYYAEMWRREWVPESPIGGRSPWQAYLEGGDEALDTIEAWFRAQGF